MKQKTMTLIALAALVVLVGSCDWKVEKKINLSEVTATLPNVQPFERIRIDAICDVHYTQGDTTKVKIVASDSEVMKKTKITVGGGCLDIRSNLSEVTATLPNVQPFERIRIDAICDVHYTQGDTTKVKIVASDSEVMKKTKITVGGGCLDIRSKGRGWSNWKRKRTVSIYVTSPDLIEVDMHGVGSFNVEGNLDTDTLRLRLKGTGDMDFQNIICDRIEAHLEGVGNMDLHQLQTQHAEISLKGVGDLNAHFVKTGSVNCSLKGVGDIDLSGEVKSLQKRKQGTGKIDDSDLKIG